MDVSDLIHTDLIPQGSPAIIVNIEGGGTMFGGVVVRFPSEVPILVSFAGSGGTIFTNEISVEGDTGSLDHVQHLELHKSTNPISGFNVVPGDTTTAIANFSSSFLELVDTPDSYAGQENKIVSVKEDETGLEFIAASVLSSPLTTKGDLWGFTTLDARVGVGANGKILLSDSAQAAGLGYSTRDIDAATHKINNVTDPTSAQDAATKAYVDAHTVQGTGLDTTIQGYRLLGSVIYAQTIGLPIEAANSDITMSPARIQWIAVYLPSAQTLTGIKWYSFSTGIYVANNNNRVGLYSYSGGTLTQVAASVNDGNTWKPGSTLVAAKAFSSTYAAPAGVYYVALLYCSASHTSNPIIASSQGNLDTGILAMDFTNSAVLCGFIDGQTDIPSTQACSGINGVSQPIPWVAVY